METLIVILVAIVLVSVAVLGLAISILVKRRGKFPNTHVGGNKHLISRGITCAHTHDKIEQAKVKKKIDYKKLKLG